MEKAKSNFLNIFIEENLLLARRLPINHKAGRFAVFDVPDAF
jgi:hypothetical protein